MKWKKVLRTNYAQIFFVGAAFALMVLIGSVSVSNVIQRESLATVTVALDETEKTIRAYLREPRIAFDSIYLAVQDLLDKGGSQEAVLHCLTQNTEQLKSQKEGVMGFNAMYGYIRGEFISGLPVDLGEDYIPQQRPWYQLAMQIEEADYTAPYVDLDTGRMVISLVQRLYGRNGDDYGVLVMDVDISWFMEYAESLHFAEGGYGLIVNQDFYIMAHPREQYRNTHLRELGGGYTEVFALLSGGQPVSAKRIQDTDNTSVIVFFQQLYNGWFVGVVMPVYSYFYELHYNIFLLASLAAVLALILISILLRLSAQKIRSEEENHAKSSFLARMSHEIRTPMNAILGMAELLLRKDLPQDAREDAYAIKQAGMSLLSIVNDILDFSKIESEKQELVTAEYQFASLMNDVISIIRMRVKEKPLLFITSINSTLPRALMGDVVRLRQILLNLLTNAVKYTNKGHVALTVDGKLQGDGTVMLSFAVADTGIGIRESDMEKLFVDFAQFDAHKNQGVEGSGLGLAIARNLCRLMGGDITVASRYGEGSTFTASIPQKISDAGRFAQVRDPEKHSVLVYESRIPYAHSIVYAIENLGVACRLVSTQEAFEQALNTQDCTSIFVADFLFGKAREMIRRLVPDASVVLLAEHGDGSVSSDGHVIAMPAHAIPIANILNGDANTGAYAEADHAMFTFTAPEARVLVVDDIATNLKVAQGLLTPYRVHTDCCTNGRDAIELVMANEYDIIFMDHMMPEMDGIEATETIRALGQPRFAQVPIIALTANALHGKKEMFLEKKFTDYLSKPVDIKKLNEIMEKWIPKDKRELAGGGRITQAQAPSGLSIKGVDVRKGMTAMGASEENYREVLVLYGRDIEERLAYLSETPDEQELALFTTHVHALKSASASVGAVSLSEQALFLEEAGKRGDREAIAGHLAQFRENLTEMVQQIRDALPECAPESEGEPCIDSGALLRLKEALAAEEIREIDMMIEEISQKNLAEKTAALFSEISDHVFVSEFREAIDLIDRLLGEDGR